MSFKCMSSVVGKLYLNKVVYKYKKKVTIIIIPFTLLLLLVYPYFHMLGEKNGKNY